MLDPYTQMIINGPMGLFSAICWVEGGANLLIQRSVESNEGFRSH